MNTCKLCLTQEANKKGSHIVPHFLLKRVENIKGKSARDFELGFAIGEFDTESYFGRSVPPENLEEVFGEINDEEIQANKHPLVVDHFFCASCEERFSKVESEYAKTMETFADGVYESGVNGAVAILFWATVIWRMSINKKSGVFLNDDENEVLRQLLDKFLTHDCGMIDRQGMSEDAVVKNVSYKLIRCHSFSHQNITYLIWHPDFTKVYSILIDEFILCFSVDGNYDEFVDGDFFGLKSEIVASSENNVQSNEKIHSIGKSKFQLVLLNLVKRVSQERRSRLDEFWDDLHVELGGEGETMPEFIKQEIMDELTSSEKKMGRKHNLKEIRKCTFKVLSKYGPQ